MLMEKPNETVSQKYRFITEFLTIK